MDTTFQNVIIAAIIVGAVVYLVITYVRRRQRAGCPDCPAKRVARTRPERPHTTSRR